MSAFLVCMRLADMARVHPDQIEMKCSDCGETVGVYPSGQQVLRDLPDIPVVCQVCNKPAHIWAFAPGAELEPFQSVKKK